MVHAYQINGNPLMTYAPLDTAPADNHELAELRAENARLQEELRGVGRVYDRMDREIALLRGQLADQRTTTGAIITMVNDADWLGAVACQAWLEACPGQPTGKLIGDALLRRLGEEVERG